jgi:TorA maturation chaperone TorD
VELIRSLGVLAEHPTDETERVAKLLELGDPPEPAEFSDLFGSKLYPYASVYLDPLGKLGGDARARISGFWRALAIDYPDESDHLTVMLAFYARLRELESDVADPGARHWGHARVAFLLEHLLSWLPFYLDKLNDIASPFYTRWGALLTKTLVEESRNLDLAQDLPLHLRESTPLADPRLEGGEAFLESLLAPVRSGLIFVRTDLERAGAELDLGVRIGERKYVIEALLGQDPAPTLNWLAREAELWTHRHLQRVQWTGPVAQFWADRSSDSQQLLAELSGEARASG